MTLILSKIYDLFDMVYGYYVECCTNKAYITRDFTHKQRKGVRLLPVMFSVWYKGVALLPQDQNQNKSYVYLLLLRYINIYVMFASME